MAWLSDWTKRRKITVDKSKIDANLTHFAVPVFLGTSVGIGGVDVSSIFDEVGADSKKIAITKSDGTTQIYGEIEQWDSVNEEAVIWISKSDLVLSSATDTELYIYYDNSKADNIAYIADVGSRTEVWDSDFKAVYHLKETGSGAVGEFIDSTSNNNDGQGGGAGQVSTPIDAVIYKGQHFDGNDYIRIPDSDDLYFPADFTWSFKIRLTSVGDSSILGQDVGGGDNLKVILVYNAIASGKLSLHYQNPAGTNYVISWTWTPLVDTFYHLHIKRDGNNWYLLVNNVSTDSPQVQAAAMPNVPAYFNLGTEGEGWQWLQGDLDEARFTKDVARSDEWIKAEVEADSDNLVTYGAEVLLIEVLKDIETDIRVKFPTYFEDIDTDIRAKLIKFEDILTDIRARYTEDFEDIDVDIRAKKEVLEDINIDIRVAEDVLKDIDTDIRVCEAVIKDIDSDIRVAVREFSDIATDIRVVHISKTNRTIIEEQPYLEEGYYLASTSVTINMEKIYNAVKMQFKNEVGGSWSALETFATTKSWTIIPGDGDKRIFVRFMDVNGNLSSGSHFVDAVLVTTSVPSISIEAYTDEGAGTPIAPSTYQTDTTPFFRWPIPSYGITFSYFSYAMDATPDEDVNLTIPLIVQTGMVVSKVVPLPEMTIEVANGYYYYAGDRKKFISAQATLDNGGAKDRIDVIYISGVLESVLVEKGIESDSPVAPELTEVDAIKLAEAYVPAGTVNIANVTLTDRRELYVGLKQYLFDNLTIGQHTLTVRAYTAVGTYSTATFNIWVADDNPIIGEIKCYTDNTKVIELANGLYQTTDNTPYFEWTAAPAEPGPIRYYYTEDGSEPDSGDSFVVINNYTPGVYSDGITELKVKPYDTTTGYWGETKSFTFIYGTATFTDDTAVISGSTTLKQSLKEVHVKEISWDFDSARICRFFQPVAFDANLPFSEGDIVNVVYGASNTTLFTGKIRQIERTIDIGHEGVTYHCSGPRQDLNEEYAYIVHDDYGETSQITFEDESLTSAINTIVGKFPKYVKNIESYPSGANMTDEYVGQVVANVLDSIYAKTKYGWYMRPNGSLVSIDLTATNPEQAKFGIYGTTVNAISPQYNVMASNLQFDMTNRYNKCIIEGARKLEKIWLWAHCMSQAEIDKLVGTDEMTWDARYKIYEMDSKWPVVKLIETHVTYSQLLGFQMVAQGVDNVTGGCTGFYFIFLNIEVARDNELLKRSRDVSSVNAAAEGEEPDIVQIGYTSWQVSTSELPQGTLGPNNTIRFSKAMYNYWPLGARIDERTGVLFQADISLSQAILGGSYGVISYSPRTKLEHRCAQVKADVLIETVPLKVTVTVPGTASSISKTLRIANTSFQYSEDPDNPIDDTARMTQYAQDLLQKYKDIKVNGSITLDKIDLDWDLNKTVNLINTDQASWSSINAKVIGIRYDFDANTTTLEITSEYLK